MHKTAYPLFFLLILGTIPPAIAFESWKPNHKPFQSPVASQMVVSDITYSQIAPDKFLVMGTIQNPTGESREIVLRGLLTFYDRTVPKGDVPIFSLRKDATIILRGNESTKVQFQFISEGKMPRGALRIEPKIRVRRQRVWNY